MCIVCYYIKQYILHVIPASAVITKAKFTAKIAPEKSSTQNKKLLYFTNLLELACSPSHMLDCSVAEAQDVGPHTEHHLYCSNAIQIILVMLHSV